MSTPLRIAIVGGGLAGLLTALPLARAGARVIVHERRATLGGRARCTDHDGFRFNLGPHALYREGALARSLRRHGIPYAGPINPVRPVLWVDGREEIFPADPWSLLRTAALDWSGRWELARLMASVRSLDPTAWDHQPVEAAVLHLATNLSRDRLRRRRRLHYVGPWLPAPVDDPAPDPEVHHARREACSYAWLVSAEALTPTQRAVLLLRDVHELSVTETAEVLGMGESNVKVSLHRARKALGQAPEPGPLSPEARETALSRFASLMAMLAMGEVEAARQAMTDDAVLLSDGGGIYAAARVPVVGVERITRFFHGIARWGLEDMHTELRMVGGLPAILFHRAALHHQSDPPDGVTLVEFRDGRAHRIYSVLTPRKLVAVRLPTAG